MRQQWQHKLIMEDLIMKRILLMMSLLVLSFQSFARDINISSWVELTDMVLQPNDCIIKGDFDGESFEMPKYVKPEEQINLDRDAFKEFRTEQYPGALVVRKSSDPVILERIEGVNYHEQALQWNKNISKNQPNDKYSSVDQSACRSDTSTGSINACTANVDEAYAVKSGARYYVEEDSWWKVKTKDRSRFSRHLIIVPASQRNAFWRTVTVIKPTIYWNGHGRLGKFFTYGVTEECRFSSPLKVAALLSLLGAGLFACYKTL